MKRRRARPPIRPRRLVGVGAGVLLVTLATGARGPVTGSLEAFVKPAPSGVPLSNTAIPDVSAVTGTMGVKRAPSPAESATGVASSSVTWADIPTAALNAYRTAEVVLRQTAPGCNLTWEVLAGIGRVESDHGRYGGATVGADGIVYPPIYGVALDGTGDIAEIRDTDDGALDGDPVWDRAVGPMQFLPSTWDIVGVDADDDGVANPHDLDDAALAAGVYLCAGDVDLNDPAQLREALWRYNPSAEYGALVRSYIEAYRRGEPVPDTLPNQAPPVTDVPSPTHPPTQPALPPLSASFGAQPVANPHGPQGEVFADLPLPTLPHGPHGPSSDWPVDWPHPQLPPIGQPDDPNDPPGGTPQQPSDDPTSPPDDQPSDDPTPTDPTPTDPSPTDTSTPTDPGPSDSPTDPAPTTPSGTDDGSTPSAPADSGPELTTISGILQHTDAGWSVDTTVVYLGPDDYVQGTQAAADYDGDGATETIAAELAGLAGREVSLEVRTTETSTAVYTIQGLAYRPSDGSPAPWESA